jgi:hypothetical protein
VLASEWRRGCLAALGSGGPAFGLVFEQDGFDELFDHGLLGGVEVGGGLEGELRSSPGPRSAGEDEGVCADLERYRYIARRRSGRRGWGRLGPPMTRTPGR